MCSQRALPSSPSRAAPPKGPSLPHLGADVSSPHGATWHRFIPFVAQPFDPDETYLNDLIGYPLAAFGFCFQLFNGFSLPFPFNLVFLPLSIIEWFLRFQISMEGVK